MDVGHYELNGPALKRCYRKFSKRILEEHGISEEAIKAIAKELAERLAQPKDKK